MREVVNLKVLYKWFDRLLLILFEDVGRIVFVMKILGYDVLKKWFDYCKMDFIVIKLYNKYL